MTAREAVAVAVDGGGSKTDVVALSLDGRVVARVRGPGSSPHMIGLAASVSLIDELVTSVVGDASVVQADLYLSGLDLPIELERYREALTGKSWAASGLVVDNDLFALLRAGTEEPDAVAVICGTGINAVGIRADGATVRFPSLGEISGDWGGGYGLGTAALWHAARAVDGRGPSTSLVASLIEQLGVDSIAQLIEQLHFGERESADLAAFAPAVLAAASSGDAVAESIIDRQADEIVAFVRAIVARLGFENQAVTVVLGGGLLEADTPRLRDAIVAGIGEVAPLAQIVHVDRPPIVGAAMLALAHAGAPASALALARTAFEMAVAKARTSLG